MKEHGSYVRVTTMDLHVRTNTRCQKSRALLSNVGNIQISKLLQAATNVIKDRINIAKRATHNGCMRTCGHSNYWKHTGGFRIT